MGCIYLGTSNKYRSPGSVLRPVLFNISASHLQWGKRLVGIADDTKQGDQLMHARAGPGEV